MERKESPESKKYQKVNIHYERYKRKPVIERLMAGFIPVTESGCWIWERNSRSGYGLIRVGSRILKNMKMVSAHRISYEAFVGDIPEGKDVLHKCDVPSCINPNHLFLGTHQDNMADKANKGRAPTRKGEQNNLTKLTEKEVLEIRANKYLSVKELSEKHKVSKTNIYDIQKRRIWRHV